MPDGSAVEVVGVCRRQGEGVVCWDQEGKPEGELSRHVSQALRDSLRSGVFYSTPRLKSRILIVRDTTDRRGSWSVRFAYLRGQVRLKGQAVVDWPKLAGGRLTPMLSAYQVDMLPEDRTTSMFVEVWKGLGVKPLPPRVGASIQMAGQTLTVVRISRGGPEQAKWFNAPPEKIWIERVEFKGRALPHSGATPGLSEVVYVGPDGKLASAHDRNVWRRKHPKGPVVFRQVDMTYRSPGPHLLDLILNIDPRLIHPVTFGGLQTKIVEI